MQPGASAAATPASRAAPGSAPLTGPDPRRRVRARRARRWDRAIGWSASWPPRPSGCSSAPDELLKRRVSLRVNFYPTTPTRAWFLREAEALAQLDHPAIRHVYDAGVVGDLAYRVGNWIDGEGLQRGGAARPPADSRPCTRSRATSSSALEHAHLHGDHRARGSRRVSVLVSPGGRGTVTDLRFCSWTLPAVPPGVVPTGLGVHGARGARRRGRAIPPSDIYTAGAMLYYAVTGQEPAARPAADPPPTELRPTCPRALERIMMRALRPAPDDALPHRRRDAGGLRLGGGHLRRHRRPLGAGAAVAPNEDRARWEKRLRRALGDDYELLELLGTGGFGRVYRVRDLHLEREVALKVLHPSLTRDPAVVERFRREAQLAARLNHPNIVNIYDIGGRVRASSGTPWS